MILSKIIWILDAPPHLETISAHSCFWCIASRSSKAGSIFQHFGRATQQGYTIMREGKDEVRGNVPN